MKQVRTDMRRGFDNPIAFFGWPRVAVSLSEAMVELERSTRLYLRTIGEVQRSFVAEQHRQGEPTPCIAAEPEQVLQWLTRYHLGLESTPFELLTRGQYGAVAEALSAKLRSIKRS